MDWLDAFALWFVEWLQALDAALGGVNATYRPLDRIGDAARYWTLRALYRVAGDPRTQKKTE